MPNYYFFFKPIIIWEFSLQNILTFLAILVALFNQQIWATMTKPRIHYLFKKEYPYVKLAALNIEESRIFGCKWLRLRITNSGRSVAQSCETWLEGLEKWDNNSKLWKNCEPFDPIILHWVGNPMPVDNEFKMEWITKNLSRNSTCFVDIGFIEPQSFELNLETSIPAIRGIAYKWPAGNYRLHFVTYGNNIAAKSYSLEINTMNYNTVPQNGCSRHPDTPFI
jgi:hypothetical protein